MATNSNTKQLPYQVNTFAKGMDTDTSDALISNEAYRLAKNLRYITDIDETTGELRLVEGASIIPASNNSANDLSGDLIIRAFCSIRNVGAIICENQNHEWAIFRINFDNAEYSATRIFGWCTDLLDLDTKISTVLKHEDADENDTLIQLYIADGKHPVMKINLYDTSNSSNIEYITNGMLFSELKKVNIDQVLSSGRLEAGLVQYTYRLYNKNNIATQVAPLSDIKAITGPYVEKGAIGLQEQEVSSMGLRLKIKVLISNIYPKIQIYRILYLENGQLPRISLICDEDVVLNNNNELVYDDLGTNSLQELTQEEFNSFGGQPIHPKVIESKNNILFAGNIRYDVDVLDDTYLNMDFRAFSSGDGVTLNDWPSIDLNVINTNLYFTQEYDEDAWKTIKPNYTNTIGGYGPNIEWKFGEDRTTYEINNLPSNLYTGFLNLRIKNDHDKYNHPIKRGLMHDEIYRYGIILYSKFGTKYPVKWIADIRTPNIKGNVYKDNEEANRIRTLSHIGGYINQKYEQSHLLYPVFKIRESIFDDKISGYEIVRVHRSINDMATITLGIIASTVEKSGRYEVSSSGVPFLDHVVYVDSNSSSPVDLDTPITETDINVLLFYSPEISYQSDDIINILKSDNNIYLLCLYPLSSVVGSDTITPITDPEYEGAESDGQSITSPNLTVSMYANDKMFYKNYYKIFSNNKRLKWYDAKYVKTLFLGQTLSINPTTINELTYMKGFNLYKLHRSSSGMPPWIFDYDEEDDVKPNLRYNIQDYLLIKSIDWNKLITNQSFDGKDYLLLVGTYTVFDCIAPYIIENTNGEFTINHLRPTPDSGANKYRDELIATCDPSLAIYLDPDYREDNTNIIRYFYRNRNLHRGDSNTDFEYSMLCNIRRDIVPYGGFTKYSRDHSTYVQHGYYFKSSYYDDIEVFDGDTSVTTYEFATAHKWAEATHVSPRCSIVCQVAVESSINIDLDSGDRFSNNESSNPTMLQVNPCNINDEYVLKKPSYVYNTAYSIDPQLMLVNYSLDQIEDSIKNFDYRVHYSNPASDNQASDPWLTFLPLNYLDVDSKYGPITNLRTFKNELIFWQENAAGVLSVNERVQIATDSNLPLILGTGGVLERYDYLTTVNGMKENEHADALSNNLLYWWDHDNNTICAYGRGSAPVLLSKMKSVQNMLNRSAKGNHLINSDILAASYPLLIHDGKYNEILFKVGALVDNNINTLTYNEYLTQFVSTYDIDPLCYFNVKNNLMFLHKEYDDSAQKYVYNMYKWNTDTNMQSLGFEGSQLKPYLKYIINDQSTVVKVYDNAEFAGTIPNNNGTWNSNLEKTGIDTSTLTDDINFEFKTPLRQVGKIDGTNITNRQLDFKFAVPRCGYEDLQTHEWITKQWGDRMRGKTMQCEMSSKSNSLNFSLQYIITKYRISWS